MTNTEGSESCVEGFEMEGIILGGISFLICYICCV
jgi:hypothetical protein